MLDEKQSDSDNISAIDAPSGEQPPKKSAWTGGWKGDPANRHVLTTADHAKPHKSHKKIQKSLIARPIRADGTRPARKKGQNRLLKPTNTPARKKWRRDAMHKSAWWRQRVVDGGCGRPRKGYIDENGRECAECGWYKPFMDAVTGEQNFHRNNVRGTFGWQSKCKACRSKSIARRSAERRKESE